jgi:glucose/arabinose dehydrogenase
MKKWNLAFLISLFLFTLLSNVYPYQVELVLDNLDFPLAMAWAPDGRLFYAEKNTGNVRVVQGDTLLPAPWVTVPNVDPFFERGLLGITIDPDFDSTGYVFLYYTTDSASPEENRVIRYTDIGGVGQNPQIILQAPILTLAGNHNGGNIHFGPDSMLYVTIGENANPAFSQDSSVIYGKILRIHKDGSIPTDNPFFGLPGWDWRIYAWGLRNSFDFDFDPVNGNLVATENGPNCDDEINLIISGGNYGWRPSYPCGDTSSLFLGALLRITPTTAPAGGHFYTGSEIPAWQGNYFFAEWNTRDLIRMVLMEPARDTIDSLENVNLGGADCRLDVETGPDGALWFSTTNRIYRIVGDTITAVEEESKIEPWKETLDISNPSPNPFTTSISFTLSLPDIYHAADTQPTLTVLDITGRKVKDFSKGELNPGISSISWDGRDDRESIARSGIYFLVLKHGSNTVARKVTYFH